MTTEDKAQIGEGDVPITIEGKTYILKPSYKACSALARGEGLVLLSSRCQGLEIDALTRVVAEGLGKNPPDLAERLYKSELMAIRDACVVYLSVLAHGGRKPKAVKEAEGDPLGSSVEKTAS